MQRPLRPMAVILSLRVSVGVKCLRLEMNGPITVTVQRRQPKIKSSAPVMACHTAHITCPIWRLHQSTGSKLSSMRMSIGVKYYRQRRPTKITRTLADCREIRRTKRCVCRDNCAWQVCDPCLLVHFGEGVLRMGGHCIRVICFPHLLWSP